MSSLIFLILALFIGYCFKVQGERALALSLSALNVLVYIIFFQIGLQLGIAYNGGVELSDIFFRSVLISLVCVTLNIFPFIWFGRNKNTTNVADVGAFNEALSLLLKSFIAFFPIPFGFLVTLFFAIPLSSLDAIGNVLLVLLLFFIGLHLRQSKIELMSSFIFSNSLLVILTVIITSWIAGFFISLVLDTPIRLALAVVSGFGWYSLSGVLVAKHFGVDAGFVAFLVDLQRELWALFLIPYTSRYSRTGAIALGGATAVDFTLPIITKHVDMSYVPVAITSGIVLSILSPIIIINLGF